MANPALDTIIGEVVAYFDELDGESPRAAAILAVAALEDELDALLRSKFPPSTSNTRWKLIAGPEKPFGSLEAKRNVAEVFGFFGPKTNAAIKCIATVRNKFAHRTNVRDFDHPQVLEQCRELSDNPVFPYTLISSPEASDIRWHYINTVKELTDRLCEIRYYVSELDENAPEPLP